MYCIQNRTCNYNTSFAHEYYTNQVGHEHGVHLRMVEALWYWRMAMLTGVVHPLQPVVREVLAGIGGKGDKQYTCKVPDAHTCTL